MKGKKLKFNIANKMDDDVITSVPVTVAGGDEKTFKEKYSDFFNKHKSLIIGIIIVLFIILIIYLKKNKISNFDGNKITKGLRSDSQSASWDLKDRINTITEKQNKFFGIKD
jgi:hypothetical protein